MGPNATMHAVQMIAPDRLLRTELAVPRLREGEILIRTAFVGVCGTDIHLWQGKSFYFDHGYLKYPFVFGHEYTGTVAATCGAEGLKEGDRVVGHCMVECHVCDNCRRGRRHLCRSLKEVGLRYIAGAAAEYVAVPAYAVTKLPDHLSFKAATLVEPSVTAYHALQRVNVQPDDRVAVIGSGALGLLSLLLAKLTAAQVDVIGIEANELELARSLGADRSLRPDEVADNAYSVVIECSGTPASAGLAARILDLGGRCSLVGVCDEPSREFVPSLVTLKDLTFHGILHGLDYYVPTVELFASGRIDPTRLIAYVGHSDEVPDIFHRMISPQRSKPKHLIEFAGERS
jgi:2-desacetyl-2-hydroxyethyl bacteriochlorophyllide A dehydrogenase